ncbi:conserved hypothetical protein [Hyphomicrobiales bacterium]|nr:conserved hypothetical protein [Hyphomicrobiales bacterium]CAH1668585.1 conserved hypothetical protein [Hyphomicrobiales bacterium]
MADIVSGAQAPLSSDREPMAFEEFEGVVRNAIEDAEDYIDSLVAPRRQKATAYFNGEPFGNEQEGRSQYVVRVVQDAVRKTMPSLMRIFASGENAVEYAPTGEEDVEGAAQSTDYHNLVFQRDNPGYQIMLASFEDALVRITGVLKWWTETFTKNVEQSYEGLTPQQVQAFEQDPTVTITALEQLPDTDDLPSFAISIIRANVDKRTKIAALPPEEFLVSREARDEDCADLIGHRTLKTLSELTELGYDPAEIEEVAGGSSDDFDWDKDRRQRLPGLNAFGKYEPLDPAMKRYLYIEAWMRIDMDGDGVAELLKICTVGNNYRVVHYEPAEDVPLAVLCPFPTPHAVIGQSLAEQVMDLQEIESDIIRSTLDSLVQTINPRTEVVENQVNIDDVLNVEVGAIVRVTQSGAVRPLATPFVGDAGLQMMSYFDAQEQSRTGITDISQGLDPKALRSTTATGVDASVSASQARVELIARNFAEGGMKRLFRGLLLETKRHQDRPRMIRLRNKFVEVDPRTWNANMDVSVNVALGRGTDSDRLQFLMRVSEKQEAIIQQFGPSNPVAGVVEWRNTMEDIAGILGRKDTSRYFKDVSEEDLQKQIAQQKQNEKPNPADMLVMAQAEEIKNNFVIKMRQQDLDKEKLRLDDDRQRDKQDGESFLKGMELFYKYGQQPDMAILQHMTARNRFVEQNETMTGTMTGAVPMDSAASSSGRTPGFGPGNAGSSPAAASTVPPPGGPPMPPPPPQGPAQPPMGPQ